MDNNLKLNGDFIVALSRGLLKAHKQSELLFYQNGLTMAQFMVLEALYHKGDLAIKDIITALLSSSGNITVVLRNLEKRGLVCRTDNPEDKRSYLICLTASGRKLIVPIFEQHMQLIAAATDNITPKEKKHIINTLKKM